MYFWFDDVDVVFVWVWEWVGFVEVVFVDCWCDDCVEDVFGDFVVVFGEDCWVGYEMVDVVYEY